MYGKETGKNQNFKTGNVLSGGGEMGKLIRSMDWSKNPLGPIDSWPQSLLTAVNLCLASNFPIALTWGPQNTQLYNDGFWPICGGKHPQSMGQDYTECWAEAWPDIGEAYASALAGETAFLDNMRTFINRYGYLEEAFFTFSFTPILDEAGNVGGIFHPVIEKTAEILAERRTRALRDLAARTSEAKSIDQVFTLAAEALSNYTADLPFVLFYLVGENEARMCGCTGLVPETPTTPVSVDLHTRFIWPLEEVKKNRKVAEIDDLDDMLNGLSYKPYPEPPKKALVLPVEAPGTSAPSAVLVAGVSSRLPLNDAYRNFIDLLANTIGTAIANAKAYEEERKRAHALAEIDRAKTVFFSNVSHEFRTPLTLMLNPIEDILRKEKTGMLPEDRELLTVAFRNALRLQKLVNSLLDFSRIEAGRISARYRPTDLSWLTQDLASNFRSATEKAGLQLEIDCPALPEPVYVDHDMWEKIVLNLLSNAFKHTFEGVIKVALNWASDKAELVVQDTGIGIPPDQLPHLFKRFHRVPNARSRTHEGSGIGLALVNELVKQHGGTINIESEVDSGTKFTVFIPAGKAHLPADCIEVESSVAPTALGAQPFVEEAFRWLPEQEREDMSLSFDPPQPVVANRGQEVGRPGDKKAHVIVADDNADMREYLRRLLSPYYILEVVADGAAALKAANRIQPDLILSDIMMPKLDGFGLLDAVRNNPSLQSVPVILLSARAGEEARIEGIEAGADDYLVKPFSARELLASVKSQLRLNSMRIEMTEALQKSLDREKLVGSIVDGIRSETELNKILQKMVSELGRFTRADRCNIWLYDSKENQFLVPENEYRKNSNIKKIAETPLPNSPVLPFGLNHQEVIYLQDVSAMDNLSDDDRKMISDRGIKSLLHVPVLYNKKLLGVLRIHSISKKREWSAETISVVEQVAAHTAVAIYQAHLLQELKESDARKTGILESSLDAIVSMDHRGKVIDWNAAAEKLFGYNRTEAIGKNMAGLIIPERYRRSHSEGLARYLKTGRGAVINQLVETYALKADGTEFPSELTISRIQTDGPPLFTGILRDITHRKKAEQALKESEDRFRNLANNIQNLAWIAHGDGEVFWFNQRWFSYTGTTLDEMRDWGWTKVHHPDHIDRVVKFVKSAWKKGISWELTFPLRGTDGSYRWFLTRVNPITNAEGQVIQWIGTSTDIHDQKMALEKKDEFMSIASHELKTPITSVKASLQILDRMLKQKSFDAMGKFLSKAETQVDKLTLLIGDLLDVSRIRSGKLQFNYTEFAVRELIDESIEHLKYEPIKHQIIVDVDQDIRLFADKARLEQVMSNLLSNAIKYSPKADKVILHAQEEGSYLKVAVTDFGIGIAEEKQPLIFDRFYRAQETLHQFQGLGLGLYISNEIIKRHSGRMWVESTEGEGSTFYFMIPVNLEMNKTK